MGEAINEFESAFGVYNPGIEAVLSCGRTTTVISDGWEVAVLSKDWRRVLSFAVTTQTKARQILSPDVPTDIHPQLAINENLGRRFFQGLAPIISGVGSGASFAYIGALGFEFSVILATVSIGIGQLILQMIGHNTGR